MPPLVALFAFGLSPHVQMSATTAAAENAVLRAVLIDGRAHLKGDPVPCLSAVLKRFGDPKLTSKKVPQSFAAPLGFEICRAGVRDRNMSLSEAHFVGTQAFVELDYNCPACGHGYLYALKRVKAGWRVVGRQTTWIS